MKPSPDSVAGRERVLKVLPIESLVPSSFSIRQEPDDVSELIETVKTHGVLQPLLVRPCPDEPSKFEVIIGSRRLRAAEKVGLESLLCIVLETSDQEAAELQWIENINRRDLSDYEKGRWLKEMLQKYQENYPSMDVLAKKVGYEDHGIISLLIKHYEHVEEEKKSLPTDLVTRVTKLPERVTREIRKAPEELRPQVIKAVVEDGLSSRETEKLVKAITLPNVSVEEAVKVVQEDAEKRRETEEKRQEALVKKFKQCYPVELVDEVTKRTSIVGKSEGTAFKIFLEIVSAMWRKLGELGLIDQILTEKLLRDESKKS